MGLETGTTIAQLDATWPIGASDQVAQGDDHLRLLKSVLKTQFPGVGGQGFNTPITAKEADLNALPQLLLDRASFIVSKISTQILSSGVNTDITWDLVTNDNKSKFAVNQYTIDVNLGGLWLFGVDINFTAAIVGNITINLKKNGSISKQYIDNPLNTISFITPMLVASNDIVSISVLPINTITINNTITSFWGFKVI